MSQQSLFRIYNVAQEYKMIEKVGRGTYGTVYKAKHLRTGELVAIKKIENKDPKAQAEGFHITALREINLLKFMDHKNIVRLKEIIMSKPQKRNLFRGSTFLVFEYMDHDLAGLFRHKIRYTTPEVKVLKGFIQCIIMQIIEGVKYLHDSKILHRDIKSANLLLNSRGEVKIADFGLGRKFRPDFTYTSKVVTLWYRAPELLLGTKQYSEKIDMWSVGCILAEFLIGQVLIRKDTQFLQMQQIYEICGGLQENNYMEARSFSCYNDFKHNNPNNPKKLTDIIRGYAPLVDNLTLDLLNKLLELNPKNRLTSDEALRHPYFTEAPLPCKPSQIRRLQKEYHEMFREPKPVEKREQQMNDYNKKPLPKAFEHQKHPPPPPPPSKINNNKDRSMQKENSLKQQAKQSYRQRRSRDRNDRVRQPQYRKDRSKQRQRTKRDWERDNIKERQSKDYDDRDKAYDSSRAVSRDYRDKYKDNDRYGTNKDRYEKDRYERSKYNESRSRSRSRDRQRQKVRERERQRSREKPLEREKGRSRQKQRDRSYNRSPHQSGDRERERERERQRQRDKYRQRERSYSNGREKPGEKIYQKESREYYRGHDRERDRQRDRDRQGYHNNVSRDRERDRSRDRQRPPPMTRQTYQKSQNRQKDYPRTQSRGPYKNNYRSDQPDRQKDEYKRPNLSKVSSDTRKT